MGCFASKPDFAEASSPAPEPVEDKYAHGAARSGSAVLPAHEPAVGKADTPGDRADQSELQLPQEAGHPLDEASPNKAEKAFPPLSTASPAAHAEAAPVASAPKEAVTDILVQSGSTDGIADVQPASSTSANLSPEKSQPGAIDIDSILKDLDEEEEAVAEEFDAMLNEEEGEEEEEAGAAAMESSIFDPEVIEGVEDELRRELAGEDEGSSNADEGGMLFDPDLIDSLEEELRGTGRPQDNNRCNGAGDTGKPMHHSGKTLNNVTEAPSPGVAAPAVASKPALDDGSSSEYGSPANSMPNGSPPTGPEVLSGTSGKLLKSPANHPAEGALQKFQGNQETSTSLPVLPLTRALSQNDSGSGASSQGEVSGKGASASKKLTGLHMQRLQSYKEALEAQQRKQDVPAEAVRSSEGEDRSVIMPGVVSRLRESFKRTESQHENPSGERQSVSRSVSLTSGSRDAQHSQSSDSGAAVQNRIEGQAGAAVIQNPNQSSADNLTSEAASTKASTSRETGDGNALKLEAPPVGREPGADVAAASMSTLSTNTRSPAADQCGSDEETKGATEAAIQKEHEDPKKLKELSEAGRLLFSSFERRCPPDGDDAVVLYVTSVRAIRKTFDDCTKLRTILQGFRIIFQERDASNADVKTELRRLLGGPGAAPQLFIRGHYIGDGDVVLNMHEDHYLVELLEGIPREGSDEDMQCEACKGRKLVACKQCGGNHKVVGTDGLETCASCNEQGLVPCGQC